MDDIANDKNTPTIAPQNEWTAMIEAVAQRNQRGTSLTPEMIAAGVPITGAPLPAVRSADLGRASTPMVPVAPPLTPEQFNELNRQALAAGVHPSQIPGFDASSEDMGPYGSLEEAIAVGAPVGSDPEEVAIGARKFREAVPVFAQPAPLRGPDRQTAREFLHQRQQANSLPRLPDFSKVQMVDMVNGKVYVDGMEFSCTQPELKMLRKFCVNKAKEQVTAALDKALKELEAMGDGDTAV